MIMMVPLSQRNFFVASNLGVEGAQSRIIFSVFSNVGVHKHGPSSRNFFRVVSNIGVQGPDSWILFDDIFLYPQM